MIMETFVVGPFECNAVVLADEESHEAVVIDPGADHTQFEKFLAERGLKVKALLHTHAHLDHIWGTRDFKEKTDSSILLHKADLWLYENLPMQAGMFGWSSHTPIGVDQWLEQGLEVAVGALRLSVLHTPGHTPGSVCFSTKDPQGRPLLLSGDTLFAGSVGRTDLWGGSHPTLIGSIHDRLMSLADHTLVIPGHGEHTTIGRERKANPFLKE